MKELLVNHTGKKLIEKNGFFIADTSPLPAIIGKHTFLKDKWGKLYIINFINMDLINFSDHDMVKKSFYEEMYFFKTRTNANAVVYFKVFVSEQKISQEITDSIMGYYMNSMVKKVSFVPVIVTLSNKKVISNMRKSTDGIGLISTLESSLKEHNVHSVIYDLEEVQKSIQQETGYTELQNNDKHSRPYITYFLVAINILIFIIMEISGGTQDPDILRKFGIKVNSLIIQGEYWRLLSSAFIHIGFAHIAFNMYGLYNLGALVERIYGSKRYLSIYLFAALSGSISSFIFSTVPSAGASGAIFGLFGALLYLGWQKPRLFTTSFGTNILIVLGFNLVYGFTATGIDNFAHIGGLIGGFLCASITGFKNHKILNAKKILAFILSLVLLFSGVLAGIKRNTASWEYYYEMGANSFNSGNMEQSQEYLEKAASLGPDAAEAHALLSLVYYSQKKDKEGMHEFNKAVNLNKNQPDLYFNLGNLFFRNKRYKEAEDMFKRFIEIRPHQYEGYLNLGVTLNMAGKYDEAEMNFKRAVDIAPNDLLVNLNLGYLYIDKGNYSEAKKYIIKANKIAPGDSDVKKTLEFLKSKGY